MCSGSGSGKISERKLDVPFPSTTDLPRRTSEYTQEKNLEKKVGRRVREKGDKRSDVSVPTRPPRGSLPSPTLPTRKERTQARSRSRSCGKSKKKKEEDENSMKEPRNKTLPVSKPSPLPDHSRHQLPSSLPISSRNGATIPSPVPEDVSEDYSSEDIGFVTSKFGHHEQERDEGKNAESESERGRNSLKHPENEAFSQFSPTLRREMQRIANTRLGARMANRKERDLEFAKEVQEEREEQKETDKQRGKEEIERSEKVKRNFALSPDDSFSSIGSLEVKQQINNATHIPNPSPSVGRNNREDRKRERHTDYVRSAFSFDVKDTEREKEMNLASSNSHFLSHPLPSSSSFLIDPSDPLSLAGGRRSEWVMSPPVLLSDCEKMALQLEERVREGEKEREKRSPKEVRVFLSPFDPSLFHSSPSPDLLYGEQREAEREATMSSPPVFSSLSVSPPASLKPTIIRVSPPEKEETEKERQREDDKAKDRKADEQREIEIENGKEVSQLEQEIVSVFVNAVLIFNLSLPLLVFLFRSVFFSALFLRPYAIASLSHSLVPLLLPPLSFSLLFAPLSA